MLSFFLPPSLCDLDVGLEAGSFIEQVAWNRTIQVDSSCHGNSRFPFWRRRGRDAGYPTPPAQIPACGFPAPGSSVILASAVPGVWAKAMALREVG